MPIAVSCNCGRAMRVKTTLAGKKLKCPQCEQILDVPPAVSAPVVPLPEPPRRSRSRRGRSAALTTAFGNPFFAAGAVAMLVAVVWFGVSFSSNGTVDYAAATVFVLGLCASIKGWFGRPV